MCDFVDVGVGLLHVLHNFVDGIECGRESQGFHGVGGLFHGGEHLLVELGRGNAVQLLLQSNPFAGSKCKCIALGDAGHEKLLYFAGGLGLLRLPDFCRDVVERLPEPLFVLLEFLDGVRQFHFRGAHGVHGVGLAENAEKPPVAVVHRHWMGVQN